MSAEGGLSSDPQGRVSKPGRRARRERSATESLLAVVLVIEVCVMFFVTLTFFGLRLLEPAFPAWAAFPAGGVFILLLLFVIPFLRTRAGLAVGWVLQALMLALGILEPGMIVVGGIFLLFWIYCFTRGRSLDRAKARYLAQSDTTTQGDPS